MAGSRPAITRSRNYLQRCNRLIQAQGRWPALNKNPMAACDFRLWRLSIHHKPPGPTPLPRAAATAKRSPSCPTPLPTRARGRRRRRSRPAKSGDAQRPSSRTILCLVLDRPALRHARRAGPGDRARLAGLCGRAPHFVGRPGVAGGRHAGPRSVPADVRAHPVRGPRRGHLRPAQDHDGGSRRAARAPRPCSPRWPMAG